jgi:uncharacterized protein YlxW (UPF0749 family)
MMVLLQTGSVDATQLTIPIVALGGILLSIGSLIAMWFRMIANKEKMNMRIDQLEKDLLKSDSDHKEENLGLKNTLRNTKKEIDASLEKQIQTTHQRIDRVRDDNIKSYEKLEKRIDDLDKNSTEHTSKILEAIKNLKAK